MKQIKPLHNNIVIKQDENEERYGNILVADMGKDKPLIGTIIAVGPGLINLNGVLIPNTLQVGDKVVFTAFGGQRMVVENEEYLIYKEQDILAVLENE
jgi:chaperonin GroES